MKRGWLSAMLAMTIAATCGMGDARAACVDRRCPPPTPLVPPLTPPSGPDESKWLLLGGPYSDHRDRDHAPFFPG